MKYLILLLFLGCSTIQYTNDLNIIRYKKFNKIKYDWYDTVDVKGNYCVYYKETVLGIKTNYIHGDFEMITYTEYQRR